jgi:hypothetical protein
MIPQMTDTRAVHAPRRPTEWIEIELTLTRYSMCSPVNDANVVYHGDVCRVLNSLPSLEQQIWLVVIFATPEATAPMSRKGIECLVGMNGTNRLVERMGGGHVSTGSRRYSGVWKPVRRRSGFKKDLKSEQCQCLAILILCGLRIVDH